MHSENLDPCSFYTNIITLKAIDDEVAKLVDQSITAHTDYAGEDEEAWTVISVSLLNIHEHYRTENKFNPSDGYRNNYLTRLGDQ